MSKLMSWCQVDHRQIFEGKLHQQKNSTFLPDVHLSTLNQHYLSLSVSFEATGKQINLNVHLVQAFVDTHVHTVKFLLRHIRLEQLEKKPNHLTPHYQKNNTNSF